LLSDEAYDAGLRRLREALEEADAANEELVFASDIEMGMLSARAT
jgi:hypothetical protein